MPTVELKTAASLHYSGESFFNGVKRNVSHDMFEYLLENYPEAFRFRMNEILDPPPKPVVQAEDEVEAMPKFARMGLADAIRAASDYMNPDIDGNFDADGKPAIAALQVLLQRPVTVEERDAAVRNSRVAADASTAALVADRAEAKRGTIKIKKNTPDPTVDGAVEV